MIDRPARDPLIAEIAGYVADARIDGDLARTTARNSLIDALDCGFLAIGHRMRRAEGLPLPEEKFRANVATRFPGRLATAIEARCLDHEAFTRTTVPAFCDLVSG